MPRSVVQWLRDGSVRPGLLDRDDEAPSLLLGSLVERASHARPVPQARRVRRRRCDPRGGTRRRRGQSGAGARSDRSALGARMAPDPARRGPVAFESQPRATRQDPAKDRPGGRERVVDARRDARRDSRRPQGGLSKACARDPPGSRRRGRVVPACGARVRRGPTEAQEAPSAALSGVRGRAMDPRPGDKAGGTGARPVGTRRPSITRGSWLSWRCTTRRGGSRAGGSSLGGGEAAQSRGDRSPGRRVSGDE